MIYKPVAILCIEAVDDIMCCLVTIGLFMFTGYAHADSRLHHHAPSQGPMYKHEDTWTLVGATNNSPSRETNKSTWSVGDRTHEIRIVIDPISDIKILPHSDPVLNTSINNMIMLTAAQGEIESASFVIRTGIKPLEDVHITTSGLVSIHTDEVIDKNNFDIRLVKAWFQAGDSIRRRKNDTNVLTPELLIHDDDLVRIDTIRSANLIRNIGHVEDSNSLLPFHVDKYSNQQIWINVHVPGSTQAGIYRGPVTIRFRVGNEIVEDTINISLEVLPLRLPDPLVESAIFYTSHLAYPTPGRLSIADKTQDQIFEDFKLIREYGFTNIAIDHTYQNAMFNDDIPADLNIEMLLMRQAGFVTNKLLYVDWKLTGSDRKDLYTYKIKTLMKVAMKHGFKESYIYGRDEMKPRQLLLDKELFDIIHRLCI